MITKIMPVCGESLAEAKNIILSGGAVAFPTETVYGLGADALNDAAVKNIYAIKGRPGDNPLIVHVHADYDISPLVKDIPDYAKILAKEFLPGPLTMVFKSCGKVAPSVSCGLDTVAIRVPSHPDAQKFLKYLDMPIAAPSANISKHVSPVTAEHVFSDLNGKIELVLDGGKCSGGIESTVLDCTGKTPVVLRSGLVTREMIENVVGECSEYAYKEGAPARSPGMKYKHYSPACQTALFTVGEEDEALKLYERKLSEGRKPYILCDGKTAEKFSGLNVLSLGSTAEEMAANVYFKLREGEILGDFIIAVAPKDEGGVMHGVLNRLTKACISQ